MKAAWAKEVKDDPEIGKGKLDETLSLVGKALDHFGAPSKIEEIDGKKVETNEFRALLNETGLGNHPVMVKMFRAIGAAVSEDGNLVRGDAGPVTKKSGLEVLYPDDQPGSKSKTNQGAE
jgi:hypothetical protein